MFERLELVRPAVDRQIDLTRIPYRDAETGESFWSERDSTGARRFHQEWCDCCVFGAFMGCPIRDIWGDEKASASIKDRNGLALCLDFEPASLAEPPQPPLSRGVVGQPIDPKPEIPEWAKAKAPESKIVFEGRLKKYYPDWKEHQFKWLPGKILAGKTLSGQLLCTRWNEGDRKREGLPQRYFDMAFVDAQGCASVISLQGDGAREIAQKLGVWGLTAKKCSMRFILSFMGVPGQYCTIGLICDNYASEVATREAEAFLNSNDWTHNAWAGV